MILYNRLIAQIDDSHRINAFKSEYPSLKIARLFHFDREFDKEDLSDVERDMYNTVLISTETEKVVPSHLFEQLSKSDGVSYVQYDQTLDLFSMPPQDVSKWWFSAIRYLPALMRYTSRRAVKIAVIDTGIDHTHADLNPFSFESAENRRSFRDMRLNPAGTSYENPEGDEILLSENGFSTSHGTHVAGIIAALLNQTHTVGLADQVTLMNLHAYPDATAATLAQAITYAANKRAKVINASWGGEIDVSNPDVGRVLQTAINYACSRNVVVVCAAGNKGRNVDSFVPAKFSNVIAVGSLRQPAAGSTTGLCTRANTSNYGPQVIGAPGVRIESLRAGNNNVMLTQSGTSMSAAFVTGLVARMLTLSPNLITTGNPAADILQNIILGPISGTRLRGIIDVEATLNAL